MLQLTPYQKLVKLIRWGCRGCLYAHWFLLWTGGSGSGNPIPKLPGTWAKHVQGILLICCGEGFHIHATLKSRWEEVLLQMQVGQVDNSQGPKAPAEGRRHNCTGIQLSRAFYACHNRDFHVMRYSPQGWRLSNYTFSETDLGFLCLSWNRVILLILAGIVLGQEWAAGVCYSGLSVCTWLTPGKEWRSGVEVGGGGTWDMGWTCCGDLGEGGGRWPPPHPPLREASGPEWRGQASSLPSGTWYRSLSSWLWPL